MRANGGGVGSWLRWRIIPSLMIRVGVHQSAFLQWLRCCGKITILNVERDLTSLQVQEGAVAILHKWSDQSQNYPGVQSGVTDVVRQGIKIVVGNQPTTDWTWLGRDGLSTNAADYSWTIRCHSSFFGGVHVTRIWHFTHNIFFMLNNEDVNEEK